jgi:hypothetical protein
MRACRICGEDKPFGKKDRDRRNYWCKECGKMYEEMKVAKREKEWQEAEEETRAELQKIYDETVQGYLVRTTSTCQRLAARTKFVIQRRVRGCSTSPCLTE